MLSFLLPLASKIISDAVAKIPENEELGEKLIEICLTILEKAVKLTKTDMDDKMLAAVREAIVTRQVFVSTLRYIVGKLPLTTYANCRTLERTTVLS